MKKSRKKTAEQGESSAPFGVGVPVSGRVQDPEGSAPHGQNQADDRTYFLRHMNDEIGEPGPETDPDGGGALFLATVNALAESRRKSRRETFDDSSSGTGASPFAVLSRLRGSLPGMGTPGRAEKRRLRQSRKEARKAGRVSPDRESELFLRHMQGVDRAAGRMAEAPGPVSLAETRAFQALELSRKEASGKPGKGRGSSAAMPAPREPSPLDAMRRAVDEPGMAEVLNPQEGLDPAFLKAMKGVAPLPETLKGREVCPAVKLKPGTSPSGNALQDFMDGKVAFDLYCTDECLEGHVVGLDNVTIGRLMRGDYSPEGSVDLHGLNVGQAFETLKAFLKDSWMRGMRCLIVVVGRGRHSPGGQGVIREKVRQWLTQDPFKCFVLAFCTARTCDGGAGSLYVLLRTYKKSGRVYWDRTPSDPELFEPAKHGRSGRDFW